MPKLLVPIDFSRVSLNAALYAVQMAENMPKKEVLLYNVVEPTVVGSDGTPMSIDSGSIIKTNKDGLQSLQVSLFELGKSPMDVISEEGDFLESVKSAVASKNIDIVVVGTTGNSGNRGFLGSNALNVARDNNCPVLIVPPDAEFKGISKILIAVNLQNVDETIAIDPIKKWLDAFNPEVHFVYVNESESGSLTSQQESEKVKLLNIFSDYKSNFTVLNGKEFAQILNVYVDLNKIDHIVVFPRKQGIFDHIFSTSHAEKLTHHSKVPILSVHN